MKLATLAAKDPSSRDGSLIVVSRDLTRAAFVDPAVAPSLIRALENWKQTEPKLKALYTDLMAGKAQHSFALNLKDCLAPLPNAPGFYDGSAFLSHVVRARRARGDQMPESAKKTPLMYQGVSDNLLPAYGPIELMDVGFGGDIEAEMAVITSDIPRGTPASEMGPYMVLFSLFNDITYREIVKVEIETKFGFLQSKPNSSFAPIVVTPDEFGDLWDGKRFLGEITVNLNGKRFGSPSGREMNFSFGELVAHANRTRPLAAGNIVGSGTFSNESKDVGFGCLVEKRYQQVIDGEKDLIAWLQPGDEVEMDALYQGHSIFGKIKQRVVI